MLYTKYKKFKQSLLCCINFVVVFFYYLNRQSFIYCKKKIKLHLTYFDCKLQNIFLTIMTNIVIFFTNFL